MKLLGFDNNDTGTWADSLLYSEQRHIPLVWGDLCELDYFAEPNTISGINADLCTFYSHKFVMDFLYTMRSKALQDKIVLGINLQQRCSRRTKKEWETGTLKYLLTKLLAEAKWRVVQSTVSYSYRSDLKSNMEYNVFSLERLQ
jgi:hypothetical protein